MLCFYLFILIKSTQFCLTTEPGTSRCKDESGYEIADLSDIFLRYIENYTVEVYVDSQNSTDVEINISDYSNYTVALYGINSSHIKFKLSNTNKPITFKSLTLNNTVISIESDKSSLLLKSQTISLKNVTFLGDNQLKFECENITTDLNSILNISSIDAKNLFDVTLNDATENSVITVNAKNNAFVRNIVDSLDVKTDINFTKVSKANCYTLQFMNTPKIQFYSEEMSENSNTLSIKFTLNPNFTTPCYFYLSKSTSIYIYGLDISQKPILEKTTPLNKIISNSNLQVNLANCYMHTSIYSSEYMSIVPFTTVQKQQVFLNEIIANSSSIYFEEESNISIGSLKLLNNAKLSSSVTNDVLIYNMTLQGTDYTTPVDNKIHVTIGSTLLIDHINATFNFIAFHEDSIVHIRYYFDQHLLTIKNTPEILPNQPLFITEFIGTKMPTDVEFAPYKGTIHYFVHLPPQLETSLKYSHIDDETGIIGFTKSTDITQAVITTTDSYTLFGFKFMDYPTRVYPHFCYAAPSNAVDQCGEYAFMFPNITGRSMSDYITAYTITVKVSLYESMIPNDVFNFDSARRPRKISVIGCQNETMLTFNMVFTSETHTSVRILDAANVRLNFAAVGITTVNIPKVYLHNVEVVNKAFSMADIDQLVVDIKTLSRLKSEGLTTFYVNIDSTKSIIFTGKDTWNFIDAQGNVNTFKRIELMRPVLAATGRTSLIIKCDNSAFTQLPFTYLSETPASTQSLEVNVTGKWPLIPAIELRTINSIVINTESENIPLKISGSVDVTMNAANFVSKVSIPPMSLPDKSDLNFNIAPQSLEVIFSDVSMIGTGNFYVNPLNKLPVIKSFSMGELAQVTLKSVQLQGRLVIPFMARLTLVDTDVSQCNLNLSVKLEEGGSRVVIAANENSSVKSPKSIFVNVTLDQSNYGLITPTYYIKSVTLISSSNKVLKNWMNLSILSTNELDSPATPIAVDLVESESLIIVSFKGFAPDLDSHGLTTLHIALIIVGSIILSALLGYGGMTLYLKLKRQNNLSDDELPNDNGVDLSIL